MNAVSGQTAAINDFCILPANQGKGLGTAALRLTVALLLERQFTEIRLSVVTENGRALTLYLNAGFDITAENQYFTGSLP